MMSVWPGETGKPSRMANAFSRSWTMRSRGRLQKGQGAVMDAGRQLREAPAAPEARIVADAEGGDHRGPRISPGLVS